MNTYLSIYFALGVILAICVCILFYIFEGYCKISKFIAPFFIMIFFWPLVLALLGNTFLYPESWGLNKYSK
jgi:lipopolysaccharide export LptBFGC system permease protein LptF